MSFASFWSDVLSTILGGAVLAFLFFLAKEKCFPLPKLNGRWYFQQITQDAEYKPFIGMILRYEAMLWLEGNVVRGTAEKIYEISSTGERPYVGKNRTRATISGCVELRYFGKNIVHLHIVEDGHGRESTYYYELAVTCADTMLGTFESMVAESEGSVQWQREPF